MFKASPFLYLCFCVHLIVVASQFVRVNNGGFSLNNNPFYFYGTNVFWLSTLEDDELDATFASIAGAGVKVVRTWAFDDVARQPSSGNYFQILQNGTSIINLGPTGLQRLDKIVDTARKYNIMLLLALTNNWNPERANPDGGDNAQNLPRGYLSNDYGGMDAYVRAYCTISFNSSGSVTCDLPDEFLGSAHLMYGRTGNHDEFYTNPSIINAFKSYVSTIVSRYANNPAIFGWELANDPRCSSTLPASSNCHTHTITTWVANIARHIKSLDRNHLVTAGDNGFYCTRCIKLFTRPSTKGPSTGVAFDGSSGVDTEDIMGIPFIDFGSFQLFPDQITYFPKQATDFTVNSIVEGNTWVAMHSNSASLIRKPSVMTAFELVAQDTWAFYVPFDQSSLIPGGPPGSGGIPVANHDYTLTAWGMTALSGNVGGVLEFQWVTGDLLTDPTHRKRAPAKKNYKTPNSISPATYGVKK